jgi:Predicted SAM-dependent methyltransferases
MTELILKNGREKSLERRHPWVFSGAVERVKGALADGGVVDVVAASGQWLGRGFYSAASQIRVRILTFEQRENIDADFFRRKIAAAWKARERVWQHESRNAVRWAHGESDGLPGLVIDRYGPVVSMQIQTSGMDAWRDAIAGAIREAAPECALFERSDTAARELEGLPKRKGGIVGTLPQNGVNVRANGIAWNVDVADGHKTGCYLDQMENWAAVGALADGASVLDAFCYNGGFALACLKGGAAKVLAVDSSSAALENAAANLALNGLDAARCEFQCKDVFAALREYRDRAMSFDMIILDPPKFADSKSHVDKACRAYKDANLLAFKLLRPGGLLATFSCSGSVGAELFQKVVADAALDAGRHARILARYSQPADHPVSLNFPEGFYLKGLLCGAE